MHYTLLLRESEMSATAVTISEETQAQADVLNAAPKVGQKHGRGAKEKDTEKTGEGIAK